MEEQKRERHTWRHPVRAFFRGMYTEVAFSGESLRTVSYTHLTLPTKA